MNPITKHFEIVYFPGFATSNQTTTEIKERTPDSVPIVKNCYGFRIFDRTEVTFEGELLKGEPKNHSGMYFIDGEVCSVDEAVQNHGLQIADLAHLRPYELLVHTRFGSWQWYDPIKDHIFFIIH